MSIDLHSLAEVVGVPWGALALVAAVFAAFAYPGFAEGAPEARCVHKGSHILTSKDLVVEVMDPNHPDRYYAGVRFASVAAVLRVSMGRDQFLFNPVGLDWRIGFHGGLASELNSKIPPPGFEEAQMGEGFVKIGVGVLKKNRETYTSLSPYEMINSAATTVTWEQSRAVFRQTCDGVRGYAYELTAAVKVEGKQVIVDWTLANTGAKPFETDHFSHNLFLFNEQPVGPDYVLSFPYDFEAPDMGPEVRKEGREIHFFKRLSGAPYFHALYPKDYEGPNTVTARHLGNGLSIRCLTSIPGSGTWVFATRLHVCPEQYVEFALEAGEKTSWRRTYAFAKETPAQR